MVDWQQIVNEYGPIVWHSVYRLLGDHTQAADCFQETFVSALQVSRRQPVQNFRALLIHLATKRAIDALRKRTSDSRINADPQDLAAVASNNPGPLKNAQTAELAVNLRNALAQLPPAEAQAFCLRFLNDMSYKQIEKALDIKTNAAGVLLHRAREKLQTHFQSTKADKI